MDSWPIQRRWILTPVGVTPAIVSTADLIEHRACLLTGAAGLGKTFELERLISLHRARTPDVRATALVDISPTAEGLEGGLRKLAEGITESTVLCLDALDEITARMATAGRIVACWIRDYLGDVRPFLRISCRTTVVPPEVAVQIRKTYGAEPVVAALQTLCHDDIGVVAHAEGCRSA